jgi:hypothetical protein
MLFSLDTSVPVPSDNGIVLAVVLISILLLPISVLLCPGIQNGLVDDTEATFSKQQQRVDDEALTQPSIEVEVDDARYNTTIVATSPFDTRAASSVTVTGTSSFDKKDSNDNKWRCACTGGFLPPGMFGNMEAVLKMGTGQCYHKES